MKNFFVKMFSPEMRLKTTSLAVVIVLGASMAGVQIHRYSVKSRTVTQAMINEGWKSAGIEVVEHTIQQKENFWMVAKAYNVDIDTIVGANPGLEKLAAAQDQIIRVTNRKGVIHRISEQENLMTIADLYHMPAETIAAVNNLGPDSILSPDLELFIPGAKPVRLSEEVMAQYRLRGIFGSPLPGRITSTMGTRTHPVGGFRGKHTGVDLAAREGTLIAAAAEGSVLQTGEGEYIGKFIILTHSAGYSTVYGHCSQILTTPGMRVRKGEVIAKSGRTGRTTGPHLHFEIRKDGIPQDPLKYLW